MDLAWTKQLRTSPSSVRYLSDSDTVVVDAPAGDGGETELRCYAGDNGSFRGRTWIEGAVADVAYAEGADTTFVWSAEDRLYAIDADTTTVRWETVAVPSGLSSVTKDAVFVYDSAILRAYASGDGDDWWATVLPSDEYGTADWLRHIDGTLLLGMGEVKTYTRQIVGIDAETGEERWRYEPDGGVRDVLFREDVIVAVESADTANSAVVRLDPGTGGEQWRYISDGVDPSIVFVGEAIHLFDDGSVVALDPETGSMSWRSAVAGAMGEISVDLHALGGTLVAETRDSGEHSIVTLDTATGDPGWEAEVGGGVTTIDRRESEGGDLYVGTDDGTLHRIAGTTGRIRWTFEGDEKVTRVDASAAPILTGDGTAVYAVSADDGRTKWSAGFGSGEWIGLGGHSVVSEAIGGPVRVYNRDDGEVVIKKQGGPAAIGADTVFTVSGGVLGAYRLGGSDTARTETNAVAFCPNCGADLTTYGDPTFCPECGTATPN